MEIFLQLVRLSMIVSILWETLGTEVNKYSEVIIESFQETNWGEWGDMDLCPNETYATALQIKMYQEDHDNIGSTGIKLFCSELSLRITRKENDWTHNVSDKAITSKVGNLGEWSEIASCGDSGMIVGFQLRVHEEQSGDNDDVATSDVQVVCAQFDQALWMVKPPVVGEWEYWGDWSEIQICPTLMAICGIRTQVHEVTGTGDATGLNNIDMKCCNLPEEPTLAQQNCSPGFHDKVIMGDFISDRDCTMRVDITRSLVWTWNESSSVSQPELRPAKEILLPILEMPGKLSETFHSFIKSRVYFDWNWKGEKMLNLSEERSVPVKITGGRRTQIWQPVGHCGWLTLSADCIVIREYARKSYATQTICYQSGEASIYFGSGRSKGVIQILLQTMIVFLFL